MYRQKSNFLRNMLKRSYLLGKKVLPESLVYGNSSATNFISFIRTRLLIPLIKSDSVVINGHYMHLDALDDLGLSAFGAYEPYETELVQKSIDPGDCVLDIGGHIGYYTLIMARAVGSQGRVYAFEPEPNNYKLLQKNIIANGYKNVVAENMAVSDFSGTANLQVSPSSGGHSLKEIENANQHTSVKVIKLDEYFRGSNNKISVIKIDVQGVEAQVITGMQNILNTNRTLTIFTEFNPEEEWKQITDIYLSKLVEQGFDLYHINEQKRSTEKVTLEHLFKTYTRERGVYTNIMCVRK